MSRVSVSHRQLIAGAMVVAGTIATGVRAAPPQNRLIGARACVAHAGASDRAPAHTMAAYRLALSQGADLIEPDLQLTKDGVLVCLHDRTLERTTNVEEVFPDRAVEVSGQGRSVKRWPVVAFTLSEIKKLDAGSWFDPKFSGETVPTFQELIDLVKGKAGLYPETKEPDHYAKHGLDIDLALHKILVANGLHTPEGHRGTPVWIQSFHRSSLEKLRRLNPTSTLIQLVWIDQYDDYLSDAGLANVATYA